MVLPLWPTRLADGLGLGSCPTTGCFHPLDSPRSTLSRAVWVPRFRPRSRSELGLACVADCPGTMPWQPSTIPSIDPRRQQSIETGQGNGSMLKAKVL